MSSFAAELREPPTRSGPRSLAHPVRARDRRRHAPEAAFRRYVRQDYLFLIDYGRLLSLGAARAPRLAGCGASRRSPSRCWRPRWTCTARTPSAGGSPPTSSSPSARRRRPTRTATSCCARRRWATSPSSRPALAPCMWGYAEIGTGLRRARAPRSRGLRGVDRHVRVATSSAAARAWARALVDDAARGHRRSTAGADARGVPASSEHELAFWDERVQRRRRSTRASPPRSVSARRRSARAAPARTCARCGARRAGRRA